MDTRKHTPRHITITLAKIKDKEIILKVSREKKTVTYKGVCIRLSADFSKDTLQARTSWQEVVKVMKGKDLPPKLLYPAKLSCTMEGQIKCSFFKKDMAGEGSVSKIHSHCNSTKYVVI